MGEMDYNKITAEVITDLAKSAAKTVFSKIAKKYSDYSKKKILILVLLLKNT